MTNKPNHAWSSVRRWVRPATTVLIVAGAVVALIVLDLRGKLAAAEAWIGELGPWAPVAFVSLYVLTAVLAIPASPLTLAGGAIFGAWLGLLYVSIGATIGAAACFLIARYVAHDVIRNLLAHRRAFQRMDRLTRRYGNWMVAVTRLTPFFPYSVLNYGFGLTSVGFWSYVWISFVCMLPGTAAFVFGADALVTWVGTGTESWVLITVTALLVPVIAVLAWWAHRKLRQVAGRSGAREL